MGRHAGKLRVLTVGLVTAGLLGYGTPSPRAGANGEIAFDSDRTGNAEIFVMNADGTGVTQLSNDPADDFVPAWSPDGTKIAFHSTRTGNFEIFVMNARRHRRDPAQQRSGRRPRSALAANRTKVTLSPEAGARSRAADSSQGLALGHKRKPTWRQN